MLLKINPTAPLPIYQQICDQIILAMAKGELIPGEQLPSVRQLAEEIGINVMTVSKAYNLLKDQGYLLTDRRRGTTVSLPPVLDLSTAADFQTDLALTLAKGVLQGINKSQLLAITDQLLSEMIER